MKGTHGMKKAISMFIVAVLLFVFSISAMADELSKVEVTYTAEEHYEITIPASQSMGEGKEITGTVTANSVRLAEGTELHVNMTSQNDFQLVCEDSSIGYTVSANGNEIKNGSDVLIVEAGNVAGCTELVFSTDDASVANATLAGEHTDTINFTADVLTEITDESVATASLAERDELPALIAVILAAAITLAAEKWYSRKEKQ